MQKSSNNNKIFRAIGLMSGTAMDGIDVALIETDGFGYIKHIGFETKIHDEDLRCKLKSCLNRTDILSPDIMDAEREFTLANIPVIERLLKKTGFNSSDIDVIGFHGQTIHHDPDKAITIQLGKGELLSNYFNVDVVYDFRTQDIKNGGQGAPLIPIYHQALAKNSGLEFPIAILNLGGVGNITWISQDTLIGFDTGPANALIDDWIKSHTGQSYDKDGETATKGKINTSIVDQFLSLNYFSKPYPKSLDRNDFKKINVADLSFEDGAATLTEMTVQSVAKGIALCPSKPSAIYVTGGGRHNHFMMQRFEITTSIPVHNVDILQWDGDAIEAEGFAYMAVRTLLNQPISFPETTGCSIPTIGGKLVKSKRAAA